MVVSPMYAGTAYIITPNAPADFENPFHVYLFEAPHLVSMLNLFFEDVECLGLEGDDVLQADFAQRRASGEKLLKLDILIRHLEQLRRGLAFDIDTEPACVRERIRPAWAWFTGGLAVGAVGILLLLKAFGAL